MKARGHMVGGAVAGAGVAVAFAPDGGIALGVVLLSALSALVPDIDHPHSTVSKRLRPLRVLYVVLLSNPLTWLLASPTLPRRPWLGGLMEGRRKVRGLIAHRSITHSLAGMVLCVGVWAAFLWGVGALVAGSRGALLARDALPASGLPFTPGILSGWSFAWLLGSAAFAAGYASHIVLDMTTRSGVPLLAPFGDRRYWILPRPIRWKTRS